MVQEFDFSAYLARIGLDSVTSDGVGLARLQTAQIKALPFENFDPLLGITPALGLPDVFAKIIIGGRGGYCFELNALFGEAVRAAGFSATRILGRVRMGAPSGGPRAHLALAVDVEGLTLLADAGFGGPGPMIPIDLASRDEQMAPNGVFQLRDDLETGETVLERKTEDGWLTLYGFDRMHVLDADIAGANHLCATWDQFPFVAHAMLSAWDGDTRVSLMDRAMTIDGPDGVERSELADFVGFCEVVQGRMQLPLSRDALAQAWQRMGFEQI